MGALDFIIHPGMLEELEVQGHFPDTGTVQEKTITTPEGEPVETWANVVGLVDLDCAISALTAAERASLDMTVATSTHKALLTDIYTAITSVNRFVSGGVNYDITGVQHDQHATMTRLMLKVITH